MTLTISLIGLVLMYVIAIVVLDNFFFRKLKMSLVCLHLEFLIIVLFITNCSSNLNSNWQFNGHGVDLQLLEMDMPDGWKLEWVTQVPIQRAENWAAVYNTPPDAFGTNSLISHSITVFEQTEDAKRFLEADYQMGLELTRVTVASMGLEQENFTPPERYTYKSLLAHDFKVIYAPEIAVPTGIVVGYNYAVWARYGNVVSQFVTIVENEEQTEIKAGEANVLPWQEVERLLKIIDERFQEAGITPQ